MNHILLVNLRSGIWLGQRANETTQPTYFSNFWSIFLTVDTSGHVSENKMYKIQATQAFTSMHTLIDANTVDIRVAIVFRQALYL